MVKLDLDEWKRGHSSFLLLFTGFLTGFHGNMVLCQEPHELRSEEFLTTFLNRGNARRQDVFHEDDDRAPHGLEFRLRPTDAHEPRQKSRMSPCMFVSRELDIGLGYIG